MIKLIAIDLDGTLLNSQGQISRVNRQALEMAHEKGIKIVLCTGRPYLFMKDFLLDLGLQSEDDYIITFNGGQVQKAKDGQVIEAFTLSLQDLKDWRQALEDVDLPIHAIDGQFVYEWVDDQVTTPSLYLANRPSIESKVVALNDFEQDHLFNKFVVSCEPSILDQGLSQLDPALMGKFSTFKSHDNLFEIVAKGVTKGAILERLASHLGISMVHVMAIGDQENDLSMIQAAGIGVAMGNAKDHIKEIADYITATNDQDGVAQAINHFI